MDKKKILLAIAYVTIPVLLAWVGYYVFHFGQLHPAQQAPPAITTITAYYDLPTLSLTGLSISGHSGTMKVAISLEVKSKDLDRMSDYEPRIVEKILFYLRKIKLDDIREPSGLQRLREGLEHEINSGAFPVPILSVAVREFVIE